MPTIRPQTRLAVVWLSERRISRQGDAVPGADPELRSRRQDVYDQIRGARNQEWVALEESQVQVTVRSRFLCQSLDIPGQQRKAFHRTDNPEHIANSRDDNPRFVAASYLDLV